MGIRPTLLALNRNKTDLEGRPWKYPPAFFVSMARDTAMADWIALDADKLKSQVCADAASHPAWKPIIAWTTFMTIPQ